MDNHEIKMLREEMRHLQMQLDDLKAAQNLDRSEAIKAISGIEEHLWPVVFKVFPDLAKSLKQINAVLKLGEARDDDGAALLKMRKLDGEDKKAP